MEELVRYLVYMLVDDRESVAIRRLPSGSAVIYEVSVAQPDLGKVIGRRGRTANALRSLVEAAGRSYQERATLDIAS